MFSSEKEDLEELYNYEKNFLKLDKDSLYSRSSIFFEHLHLYNKFKDEDLILFLKENKVNNIDFYFKLAVASHSPALFSFLLQQKNKIDQDSYISAFLYLSREIKGSRYYNENNKKRQIELIDLLLTTDLKIKNKRQNLVKVKKTISTIDSLLPMNESSIEKLLLIFKIDSDFKDIQSVFKISKIKWMDLNKLIQFVLYIQERYPLFFEKYLSKIISGKDFINLINQYSSGYYPTLFPYNEYRELTKVQKETIKLISKNSKRKVISSNRSSFYPETKIQQLKDNSLLSKISYLEKFIEESEQINNKNFITFEIAKILNDIILYINEIKQTKEMIKKIKKIFELLFYYKKEISSNSFNRKINLIYYKINSSKMPVPLASIKIDDNNRSISLLRRIIKTKTKLNFNEVLFSERDPVEDEQKILIIKIRQNIDYNSDFYIDQCVSYIIKNIKTLEIPKKIINKFNDKKIVEQLFKNEKGNQYAIKYLLNKYSDPNSLKEIKDEFLKDTILNNIENLDKYSKEYYFIKMFLSKRNSTFEEVLYDKLKSINFIYDFEKSTEEQKIIIGMLPSEYRSNRQSIACSEIGQIIKNNKISLILKKEIPSIRKQLYEFFFNYNNKFLINNFAIYHAFSKIKNNDVRRNLILLFKKSYYFSKFTVYNFDELILSTGERKFYNMCKDFISKENKRDSEEKLLFTLKEISSLINSIKTHKEVSKYSPERYKINKKDNTLDKIHTKLFSFLFLLNSNITLDEQVYEPYQLLDSFQTISPRYRISIPKKSADLIEFSFYMKNCVKGYISSINKGEIIIFNIFKDEEPFINISIRNRMINEIKYKENKKISNEDYNLLEYVLRQANFIN